MAPTTLSDDDLLDVALDAFADRGYEGMSVREVCRRLGVSHNLVNERYGSKEQLWYAAIAHGFAALAGDLAAAAQEVEVDELDRLRAILVRYVEATAERPALIRIINAEAARPSGRLDHVYERYIRPAHQVADTVLRELHHAGRARWVSPAVLHFLVGHGAGGIVSLPGLAEQFPADVPTQELPADGRRATLTEQAREAVEVVLRGLAVS